MLLFVRSQLKTVIVINVRCVNSRAVSLHTVCAVFMEMVRVFSQFFSRYFNALVQSMELCLVLKLKSKIYFAGKLKTKYNLKLFSFDIIY